MFKIIWTSTFERLEQEGRAADYYKDACRGYYSKNFDNEQRIEELETKIRQLRNTNNSLYSENQSIKDRLRNILKVK